MARLHRTSTQQKEARWYPHMVAERWLQSVTDPEKVKAQPNPHRWRADEIRQRVGRLQDKRCGRQAGPGVEGKVENPVQLDKAAHDKMWKETPKVERIIPRVNLTIPKVMLIIQQLRRTCRV